jgi:hypothetical protein
VARRQPNGDGEAHEPYTPCEHQQDHPLRDARQLGLLGWLATQLRDPSPAPDRSSSDRDSVDALHLRRVDPDRNRRRFYSKSPAASSASVGCGVIGGRLAPPGERGRSRMFGRQMELSARSKAIILCHCLGVSTKASAVGH